MGNIDPTAFVNFGVLGLIVLAGILGWIWFKPAIDRLIEERDRVVQERDKAIAQRDAMSQLLQDRLVPLVQDFTTVSKTLLPILQDLIRTGEQPHESQPPPRPGKGRGQGRRRGEPERGGSGRPDH